MNPWRPFKTEPTSKGDTSLDDIRQRMALIGAPASRTPPR
jgi:hypothetical protein